MRTKSPAASSSKHNELANSPHQKKKKYSSTKKEALSGTHPWLASTCAPCRTWEVRQSPYPSSSLPELPLVQTHYPSLVSPISPTLSAPARVPVNPWSLQPVWRMRIEVGYCLLTASELTRCVSPTICLGAHDKEGVYYTGMRRITTFRSTTVVP